MSERFNKVKDYYEKELWTKDMVANAVVKHWITEDEFELITGEPYRPINFPSDEPIGDDKEN